MRSTLIGMIGLLALAGSEGAAQGPKPIWLKDFEAAKAAAARSGKPMFVVFR